LTAKGNEVRLVLALSAGLLAAAPLLAQKPGADPERERYRSQGIALCVGELNALDGVTPDESEAICGCALDRFLASQPGVALASFEAGQFRSLVGSRVFACTFSQAPARTEAVSRWLTATPPPLAEAAPPPTTPVPAAEEAGDKPVASEPGESDFDLGAWLSSWSLPGWLSGGSLPLWLWIPLAVFVFLFLRGLMRRREERDLDGPPPWMRRGGPPRR